MYVNSFMMAQCKWNMHGRRAVLRILCSSAISEFVLCTVAYLILFFGMKSLKETIYIIGNMWVYKMAFVLLTAWPIAWVAEQLKDLEYSDVYDDLRLGCRILPVEH